MAERRGFDERPHPRCSTQGNGHSTGIRERRTDSRMNLQHLESLTDDVGLFEHCLGDQPRSEHGYCVDDVARALIVIERSGDTGPVAQRLTRVYAEFLGEAQSIDGRVVNRRSTSRVWCGTPSTDDHWGRALWAWGSSMRWTRNPARAQESLERFERSARLRSPFLRSMMFAALGAAEVLEAMPRNVTALSLIRDAVAMLPTTNRSRWPWPEERLTYANAVIPEVMLLGGAILNDSGMVRRGRQLLTWLLEVQTIAGRLSVIPHTGWSSGESLPSFDQQPIEIAALVDACSTAFDLTSDQHWREYAILGRRWFDGHNDQGIPMRDDVTGAGFDALTRNGRNTNQGAESTLAYLGAHHRTEQLLQAAA